MDWRVWNWAKASRACAESQCDLDADAAGHLLDAVEQEGADRLAADSGFGRGDQGRPERAAEHFRVELLAARQRVSDEQGGLLAERLPGRHDVGDLRRAVDGPPPF